MCTVTSLESVIFNGKCQLDIFHVVTLCNISEYWKNIINIRSGEMSAGGWEGTKYLMGLTAQT